DRVTEPDASIHRAHVLRAAAASCDAANCANARARHCWDPRQTQARAPVLRSQVQTSKPPRAAAGAPHHDPTSQAPSVPLSRGSNAKAVSRAGRPHAEPERSRPDSAPDAKLEKTSDEIHGNRLRC